MLPRKRQRIAEIGRVRVSAAIAAAVPAATTAPAAAGVETEPVSDADVREAQTVKRIEEHLTQVGQWLIYYRKLTLPLTLTPTLTLTLTLALTQIFKRDREQSARSTAAARGAQQRPSLQIKLLPTHMTIEGLNLALPYSQENQRLLRTLEQGRVPWDELRRHPELQALCDANGTRPCGYVDGNLTAEVHDLRAPEHAVLGLESRLMTLHACDDDLTQDLAELECDAVLHQGSAPWSDAFKQRLVLGL